MLVRQARLWDCDGLVPDADVAGDAEVVCPVESAGGAGVCGKAGGEDAVDGEVYGGDEAAAGLSVQGRIAFAWVLAMIRAFIVRKFWFAYAERFRIRPSDWAASGHLTASNLRIFDLPS